MRRVDLDFPSGRVPSQAAASAPDTALDARREALALRLVRSLPRLRRHAIRRVGVVHADDLVQETLVRALQRSDSFDEQRAAWPWLRAVADSAWARAAERDVRAPEARDDIDELLAHEPEGPDDSRADALALLERLRGPERDALERHYLGGESIASIASATGAAIGTVKARLSRGRRRLVLFVSGAAGALAAVLVLGPQGDGPPPPRIHHASIVVEVQVPRPPRFERIVVPTTSTDGWRIEGARPYDPDSLDTETGKVEPR